MLENWTKDISPFNVRDSIMLLELVACSAHNHVIPLDFTKMYTPRLLFYKGSLVEVTAICATLKINRHYWFLQEAPDLFHQAPREKTTLQCLLLLTLLHLSTTISNSASQPWTKQPPLTLDYTQIPLNLLNISY